MTMQKRPLHERTHVLLLYVLLRCCRRSVVGCVVRWSGALKYSYCCSEVALLYEYMLHAGWWVCEWRIPPLFLFTAVVVLLRCGYYSGTLSFWPVYRPR